MENQNKQKQGALNKEWGALAENIAAEYLIARGYTIRERNKLFGKIEIDIIAEKDGEMVFVEVKARTGKDQQALEAVDRNKQRRMAVAADSYLRDMPQFYWYRFDIITITGDREHNTVEHYPDAFLAPFRTKVHAHSTRPSNRRKTGKSDNSFPESCD